MRGIGAGEFQEPAPCRPEPADSVGPSTDDHPGALDRSPPREPSVPSGLLRRVHADRPVFEQLAEPVGRVGDGAVLLPLAGLRREQVACRDFSATPSHRSRDVSPTASIR